MCRFRSSNLDIGSIMNGKIFTRLSLGALALWGVTTSVQAQTSTTGEVKSGEAVQQSSSGLMQEQRNTGDTTKWIQLYTADGQSATVVMFPAPEHKTPTFGLSQQTQQQTSVSDKKSRSGLPQLVWGASFDFFFDNREYKNLTTNWSQSLFGARINPEIGVTWDGRHSLMMGVSLLANFGAKPFEVDNEIFGYYQYISPRFRAYAGVVPRSRMIGEYSGAFFSDSVKYYDPNLTGLLLQYMGGRGYVEFGCDWNSMFSKTTREKFLLFSAGRLGLGARQLFYLGYNLTMYHHAGWDSSDEPDPTVGDGVVDNVLIEPFVGVDFTRIAPTMQELSLRVGWINAFQNDRAYVGDYVTPGGVQIEAHVQKWNFGIHNTLYAGDNLQPYYVAPAPGLDYGPGLYWGEPFYRTDNIYDRLEIYWQPINTNMMHLRVSSVHHYDGHKWGWQQKISFTVNLGQNRIFNNKR